MVTVEDLNQEVGGDGQPARQSQLVTLSEAGSLVETLSSEKRRTIMNEISGEPTNAAALADRLGTSIQNVNYHLSELRNAGLVRVVDTHYSEKGREMNLYAPTSSTIVIRVDDRTGTDLEPLNSGPEDETTHSLTVVPDGGRVRGHASDTCAISTDDQRSD